MGTTLTAMVEVREANGHWRLLSTWSLGKDYELMRALHQQAEDDWPLDVEGRDAPRYDFRRYWMDAAATIDLAPTDYSAIGCCPFHASGLGDHAEPCNDETPRHEPSPEWKALTASLQALVHVGATARVLYVEV